MLRSVVTAIMLTAASGAARAADAPEIVQKFLDEARAGCIKAGGTPEPARIVTGGDITGDGHLDWVVHYNGYCPGAPDYFCTSGGCVIQIFRGWPDGRTTFMLQQGTISWRASRYRGLPALIFTRPNAYCPRGKRICDEIYVFERKGAMRHAR